MHYDGLWEVHADDAGGNHNRNLGVYYGPLDRIALGLADEPVFSLEFNQIMPRDAEDLIVTRRDVHIKVERLGRDHLLRWMREQDRPIRVEPSQFNDAARIVATGRYNDEIRTSIAAAARAKLTTEEIEALRQEGL